MNPFQLRRWRRLGSASLIALSLGACGGGGDDAAVTPTPVPTPAPTPAPQADARPNIIVILADDLGYSDLGAFGGEISTPNLDALAGEGRLLTDFHSAATCSPTRSMLMSGTTHHLAGLGTMAEALAPHQQGKPGYEGYLNDNSLSVASLLKDAGYHTYMAGKWHLGLDEAHSARARGFESSYTLLQGGGSHFAAVAGKAQTYDAVTYRENGALVQVPDNFFSTNFYTDKLISYIDQNKADGKPFFAYAAYTAPHWPLQAPADFIDRYKGRYDAGYDAIRLARIAKQKSLGIIPADFEANAPLPATAANPLWSQLSAEQKQSEARKMEVYAAMVENLDWNIGRLIAYLKQTGKYDNTFIFFMSDNGAEGSNGIFANNASTDNSLGNYGKVLSNIQYGKRWAEVSAAPFRLWKGVSAEGGISVPAIVRLPSQTGPQRAFTRVGTVRDIAPTLLELAQVKDPGTSYQGRTVNPITGRSLLPALKNQVADVHPADEIIADELFGSAYVRRDNWKLLWVEKPQGPGAWQLYDLGRDRAEIHDLSASRPDIVGALKDGWKDYVGKNGVIVAPTSGLRVQ
ncbi:arylsulfatase [Jeongeupia sp. USM3]|uniref:arylsulfatase n=1 Tax=Jeongeupia sp. USM3 TaxID=1906741 RepID=UPI00089DFEC9|nr:arylsulfatase [Jeongeupia sp. USM3]AOY00760.1 arylsulfatase [Jeongeupia sp. USM3]